MRVTELFQHGGSLLSRNKDRPTLTEILRRVDSPGSICDKQASSESSNDRRYSHGDQICREATAANGSGCKSTCAETDDPCILGII